MGTKATSNFQIFSPPQSCFFVLIKNQCALNSTPKNHCEAEVEFHKVFEPEQCAEYDHLNLKAQTINRSQHRHKRPELE